MGYVLYAVVAEAAVFTPLPTWLRPGEIIDLAHAFQMVPITEELLARLATSVQLSGDVIESFQRFTPSLQEQCLALSERGYVAFIENECFGGVCDQHSVVWRNKEVIIGPLNEDRAVSKALHQLGVPRTLMMDEFDCLDLGQHRLTEEWLFVKEK